MRLLRIGLVVGLLMASACSSEQDSSPATTSSAPASSTTVAPSTSPSTLVVTTPPPETTQPTASTTPAVTTSPPTTVVATTTTEPSLVDVKVYLLRGERLVIAHRQVPGPAVLRGALTELLDGPTAAERAAGLISVVPDGTTLLDLNLAAGLAIVDLDSTFESGGGSLSMMARLAQVIFTATQFDNVNAVQFWLDGAPVEFFSGEGLVLDEPQTRAMADRNISGSVIFDMPAPDATVSSPFTVTGEGDVFEAQFPIEVRANGVKIGGVAPVTAGAWGDWAEFSVTITLDAPAGPIELVGYDPGGCGTDPECPPIIETVVPLMFTG